jgi:hypothetical protein
MTNSTGSSQIDDLAAPQQPAPNSLSDTPPNGYDATIGPDAARILAEINSNAEPANGTVPSPIRNNRNNSWRLVLRLYRQHPILWVVWVIGASWLLYQVSPPFRGQVASTYIVTTTWYDSVQLCHIHGGRATFGPSRHYVMANGVTCGLPNHDGVLSLIQEYQDPSQRGVRFTADNR